MAPFVLTARDMLSLLFIAAAASQIIEPEPELTNAQIFARTSAVVSGVAFAGALALSIGAIDQSSRRCEDCIINGHAIAGAMMGVYAGFAATAGLTAAILAAAYWNDRVMVTPVVTPTGGGAQVSMRF